MPKEKTLSRGLAAIAWAEDAGCARELLPKRKFKLSKSVLKDIRTMSLSHNVY